MSADSFFGVTGRPTVMGTGLIALDVVVSDQRLGDRRVYAGGTCGNVMAILSYLALQRYRRQGGTQDVSRSARMPIARSRRRRAFVCDARAAALCRWA